MSIFSSIGKALRVGVGGLISTAVPVIGPAIGGQIAASAIKRPTSVPVQSPRVRATPAMYTTQSLPSRPGAGIIPAMSRVPQAAQKLLPEVGGAIAGYAAGSLMAGDGNGACPVGFHLDKKTRSRCVRNRRMNPLNGRAASRAIRRIKGARKMLQKIERQLPKQRASGRSRGVRHLTGPRHTE